jgi:hypothetical protein
VVDRKKEELGESLGRFEVVSHDFHPDSGRSVRAGRSLMEEAAARRRRPK